MIKDQVLTIFLESNDVHSTLELIIHVPDFREITHKRAN
jgi:hypothetical protein